MACKQNSSESDLGQLEFHCYLFSQLVPLHSTIDVHVGLVIRTKLRINHNATLLWIICQSYDNFWAHGAVRLDDVSVFMPRSTERYRCKVRQLRSIPSTTSRFPSNFGCGTYLRGQHLGCKVLDWYQIWTKRLQSIPGHSAGIKTSPSLNR